MEIKVPITPDPITGFAREAVVKELRFDRDLELSLAIEIHSLNQSNERLYDIACNLEYTNGITPEIKQQAMRNNFPLQPEPYCTRGSGFDSTTGEVKPDGSGDMTERESLFAITFEQLKTMTNTTDSDSVLDAVFEVVKMKIAEIIQRGRA